MPWVCTVMDHRNRKICIISLNRQKYNPEIRITVHIIHSDQYCLSQSLTASPSTVKAMDGIKGKFRLKHTHVDLLKQNNKILFTTQVCSLGKY